MEQRDPPTEEVLQMIDQGLSNEEIIAALQDRGYTSTEIGEAITQAHMKAGVEGMPQPPRGGSMDGLKRSMLDTPQGTIPSPQAPVQFEPLPATEPSGFDRGMTERFEEIAEAIVDERWKKMMEDVGDLAAWKEKVKMDVMAVKQELARVQARFDGLQNAIAGKVREYDASMQEVGTDIRALEKVLKGIIDPLATNVKELKAVADRLKKGT